MVKTINLKFDNTEKVVKFPTAGQILDIESLKLAYTNNAYGEMVKAGLQSNAFALDLADMIAHFKVLIPDLVKDIDVKSYTELDAFVAKKLVTVYKKQFLPWYNELLTELYKMDEEDSANVTKKD